MNQDRISRAVSDMALSAIKEMSMRSAKVEGAYYVFPKLLAGHTNSHEFSVRLLEQACVTVTPGGAFGPTGEHHVRMAYCVSENTINTAFDSIGRYFGQ